jgi:hypothetical protein
MCPGLKIRPYAHESSDIKATGNFFGRADFRKNRVCFLIRDFSKKLQKKISKFLERFPSDLTLGGAISNQVFKVQIQSQ